MKLISRAAQIALGVPFIVLGYQAAKDPGARVHAAAKLGLPNPDAAVKLNGAAMALGGAALCLNRVPRLAALGLAASMVPTTVAGHGYWAFDDPQTRAAQRTQFLKNVALAGGLLAVAAGGATSNRSLQKAAERAVDKVADAI